MGWLVGKLVGRSIFGFALTEKVARGLVFAAIMVALVGAVLTGKAIYERSVVAKHDLTREAATAKADRKADNNAAEQRGIDQERRALEAAEIKEAIDEARDTGADPRAAYYECVRRQQAARRAGQPSPGC